MSIENETKEFIEEVIKLHDKNDELDKKIENCRKLINKYEDEKSDNLNIIWNARDRINTIKENHTKYPLCQKVKKMHDKYEWEDKYKNIFNIKVCGKVLNVYRVIDRGREMTMGNHYIVNRVAFVNTFKQFDSKIEKGTDEFKEEYPYDRFRTDVKDKEEVLKEIRYLSYKYDINSILYNVVDNEFIIGDYIVKFKDVKVV